MSNSKYFYRFENGDRVLEIKFNILKSQEVNEEVVGILHNLFENQFPVNEFKNLKFILRNHKKMLSGTVNISKLFEDEAIIYIDYPGFFIDNDKKGFRLEDYENFDREELRETAIHETVHAYQVIESKHGKEILRELLKLDKFNEKSNHKKHLVNELNRFPRLCYLEGYAQVISHLGKYYSNTESSIKKRYENILNYGNELNSAFHKFLKKGIKCEFLDLLYKYPYWYSPHMYSFMMYYNNRDFDILKDYTIEELFGEFEEILDREGMIIPISLRSGKGIFDIEDAKKRLI